ASVVLRADRLAQPIRGCSVGWPQRALVVIATLYDDDAAAHQLAIRLLDKGSADQVLLGQDWEQHLPQWLGPSLALNRATQVLVILPQAASAESAVARLARYPGSWAVALSMDFARLARDIDFPGSKTVAQVSSRLRVHRTQGQVYVYGGPDRTPDAKGIEWVQVCSGTFIMGTIKGEDEMADENEIVEPQRTVVLSAFQIAATETTQQDGKTGNMPVVETDWTQAHAFCQRLG